MRAGDGAISLAILPGSFQDRFLPFENFTIIRQGIFIHAEQARLAQAIEAAQVWTLNQSAQVTIDGQQAGRVIKVASTPVARPGDMVDFTIRFDNLGNRTIGNVTIIDNLTPRLEYVPDSAQSSLKGNFSTQTNEAGSLVLVGRSPIPSPPAKAAWSASAAACGRRNRALPLLGQ